MRRFLPLVGLLAIFTLALAGCKAGKNMQQMAMGQTPDRYLTVEGEMPPEFIGTFEGERADGEVALDMWIGKINGKYALYCEWRNIKTTGGGYWWGGYTIKSDGNGYNSKGMPILYMRDDTLIFKVFSSYKKIYIEAPMKRVGE